MPAEGYGSHHEEDEIDLIELFQTFWDKRILIAKITGAFLVVGLLIALLAPKEYRSSASLMPEYNTSETGGGTAGRLLQQYGGLLGIGGGGTYAGNSNAIRVQLYPDIVNSLPVQLQLLKEEVYFAEYDTTISVHSYFEEVHSPSVFGYFSEYTIGLPGKIAGLFKSEDTIPLKIPDLTQDQKVIDISRDQMLLVEMMRERVSVSLNEETGVVTLSVEMPDAKAAAELGERAYELLTKYLTEYRTEKLRVDLEYVEEQYQEAQRRFRSVQNERAEFEDSNINLSTSKAQTELERLNSEYELSFNIYNSLAQQREQVKLKLQEQTPLFKILQPFSVPVKDTTSGLLILVMFGIFGGIFSLGWVLMKYWWELEKGRFEI